MAATSSIVDNFNDGVVDPVLWSGAYGGVSETGGLAVIPCAAGADTYAAFATDSIYSFDSIYAQAFPAALNGATNASGSEECYTMMIVQSASQVAGTYISMSVDRLSGELHCFVATDYWDDTATTGNGGITTYNATTHAWWRMRLSGANLLFETAPDNAGWPGVWSTRRTVAAPAWLSSAQDCSLILEAHRTTGTDNTAQFDNINTGTPVENPYPVEQASGTTSANATSFTVPTTAAAGYRFVYVACDEAPTLSTTSTGWTKAATGAQSTTVTGAVFVATDPTAAANLVIASSSTQQISWIYERYQNVGAYAISTAAVGSSTNSDPGAVTAAGTGGGRHHAVVFRAGDTTTVPSAAPSGYSGLLNQAAGTTSGASAGIAYRNFSGALTATEDPGAFTVATQPWVAFTILLSNPAPAGTAQTKFYLTNTAGPYTPNTTQGPWDAASIGAAASPSLLGRGPSGTAITATLAETSTTNPYYGLLGQWVSRPATGPGVVAGLQNLVLGVQESSTSADMVLTLTIWITQGDSGTMRDSVSSYYFGSEWPTAISAIGFNASTNEVYFQQGDRLVVEVGYRATNTTATSYSGTIAYGGTAGTDLAAGDTDMTRPAYLTLPITAGVFDQANADITATTTAAATVTAMVPARAAATTTVSVTTAAGFSGAVSHTTTAAVSVTGVTGGVAVVASSASSQAVANTNSPARVEPEIIHDGSSSEVFPGDTLYPGGSLYPAGDGIEGTYPAPDTLPGVDTLPGIPTPSGARITSSVDATAGVFGRSTNVTEATVDATVVREDTRQLSATTTASVEAKVKLTGPNGTPLTFGQIVVGRFILTETLTPSQEKADLNGRTMSITGQESSPPMTFDELAAQHDDLLGLPGSTIPIQFTDKSDRSGYYYVADASVDEQSWGQDHEVTTANWTLNLQRVGTDTEVDIESRLAGPLTRTNPFGLTGERWHAPAAGHSGYWSGSATPSAITRQTVDGPLTVYRGLPINVSPRWACPIESYMKARSRFILDGRERSGTTAKISGSNWELSNGLTRVTPTSNGFGVAVWDASEWVTKGWRVQRNDVTLGPPTGLTVVRNEPECVIVRLLWVLSPGRVTADLTLRRGSRFVEVHVNSSTATTLRIMRGTPEPAITPVSAGYIRATSPDANGNRYVIGSSKGFQAEVNTGGISVASAVELDAFIGVELGGDSAQDGDTAPDLMAAYLGAAAEVTRTVRR